MSTVLEQIPIRLSFSPVSNPPNAPIDSNTGLAAAWWRGNTVALQCGIFDSLGVSVNLTNATAVQLLIQDTPTSANVLLNKSLVSADIIPTISSAGWASGQQQQFTFNLLNGDTDFDLGGAESATFWLSLRVFTGVSTFLIYGAGYITVFNAGVLIPVPNPEFVSLHTQTNSTGNSTVSPTAVVHTEKITLTGGATVRNVLVSTVGLPVGARIDLALVFSCANGTTVNIYNTSTSGALLFSFIRAGDEPNALFRLVANGVGGFLNVEQVIPAFPAL